MHALLYTTTLAEIGHNLPSGLQSIVTTDEPLIYILKVSYHTFCVVYIKPMTTVKHTIDTDD